MLENHSDNEFVQNKWGYNPLHLAIEDKNLDNVFYYLNKIDPPLSSLQFAETTFEKMNVLHLAFISKNRSIIKALLDDPRFDKQTLYSKNIFGYTPIDLAAQSENDEALFLIFGNDINVKSLAHYGEGINDFSQGYLEEKLFDYLNLKNREAPNEILDEIGMCNGWEFYHQTHRDKNEYFAKLKVITDWDGTQETLQDIQLPAPLKGQYKNREDLFEQIINDLVIFHAFTRGAQLGLGLKQESRTEQYELLKT